MHTPIRRSLLCSIALALGAVAAHADPMYVSDKLVVNVYADADQDSEKLLTVSSGDSVEVLEQSEGFTKVQLPDDRQGWIKSSYLVTQPPAIVRIKQMEKERDSAVADATGPLNEQIKKLKEKNDTLQSQVASLKKEAQTAAATPPAPAPVPAKATPPGYLEGERPVATVKPSHLGRYAGFGAALLVLGGIVGYLLGFQSLARRIRSKYGSVKIY